MATSAKALGKERAPAQIVACPHCEWKGSARGLFAHARLAHPTLPTPQTKGTRIWGTISHHGLDNSKQYLTSKSTEYILSVLDRIERDILTLNDYFGTHEISRADKLLTYKRLEIFELSKYLDKFYTSFSDIRDEEDLSERGE